MHHAAFCTIILGMNEDAMLGVEMNGDETFMPKLQLSSETISCPSTPGIEFGGSFSDTNVILRKAGEHAFVVRDSNDLRRNFRVLGLTFPGKWLTSEKFITLLEKSESFYLWFEKGAKECMKEGGLSVVFETPEEAKQAFSTYHKMKFDGKPLKLQASKLFYDSVPNPGITTLSAPFNLNPSSADASRRLYALHLSSSTDQTLLASIFGSECIESVHLETNPFISAEKQAEIIFRTVKDANDARKLIEEELEIDDGDRQLTMKLLTMDEYISYVKTEYEKFNTRCVLSSASSSSLLSMNSLHRSSSPTSFMLPSASVSTESIDLPFVPAPDLSEEDVTCFMQAYIDNSRTNWAEFNGTNDLWKLCDEVSVQHSGLPDCLLKIALLNVLERYKLSIVAEWMKEHVDGLIKMWKKEMEKSEGVQRPTKCVMSSAYYIPENFGENSVKTRRKRTHALKTMMGVGEVLNRVRTVLATEEGELEIDEDNEGNYTIGGKPLSFESWGIINRTGNSTVADEHLRKLSSSKMKKLKNQMKKNSRRKKWEEKLRIMHEMVLEKDDEKEDDSFAVDVDLIRVKTEASEMRRELEEGEMSSDSTNSTISTSTDDDEDSQFRNQKRKRQKHEKSGHLISIQAAMGSVNPQFTTLFAQLYEQRRALCRFLSSSHKNAFASVLGQILSSPHGMTSAQRSQMDLFIQKFSTQNLPK